MVKSQKGFSAVEMVLGLVVVALIIGLVVYVLDQSDSIDDVDVDNTTSVQQQEVAAPIESDEDVDEQLAEIEEVNLDEEFDTSDLEAELDALQ